MTWSSFARNIKREVDWQMQVDNARTKLRWVYSKIKK